MRARTHAHIRTHAHARTHTHTHARTYARTYTLTYLRACASARLHIGTHTRTHARMNERMRARMNERTHARTNERTHARTTTFIPLGHQPMHNSDFNIPPDDNWRIFAVQESRDTPLHLAVNASHYGVMKVLIEASANPAKFNEVCHRVSLVCAFFFLSFVLFTCASQECHNNMRHMRRDITSMRPLHLRPLFYLGHAAMDTTVQGSRERRRRNDEHSASQRPH